MVMRHLDLQPTQRMAASSPATVVLMGGAAGGGKTRYLTHDNAKWYDKRHYGAHIFRRTTGELKGKGSIQEDCEAIYPLLGGTFTEPQQTVEWKFPSGAEIVLAGLQHDKDVRKWIGRSMMSINFDECNQFSDNMFWMLFSRLRNMHGIPSKFRMTCNPDPDSWVLEFVQWYLDDAGFADPEKSGKIRYFGRKNGKLVWFSDLETAQKAGVSVTSFTFIGSKLSDNRLLETADPTYRERLLGLRPVEQARYLGGNWYIRAVAGDYFQEQYFPRANPEYAREIVRWFWTADLASSPVEGCQVIGAPQDTYASPDRADVDKADWTVLYLWAQDKYGQLFIMKRFAWRDTVGAVEWAITKEVLAGPKGAMLVMWQDPGQAGEHQIEAYKRGLRGKHVRFTTTTTVNPLAAASIAGRRAYARKISVSPEIGRDDERAMFRVLSGYPVAKHDDDVSCLALGVLWSDATPTPIIARTLSIAEHQELLKGRAAPNEVRLTNRFREIL